MKQCSKCKVEKPFSEFRKRARHKDGLSSWCKSCLADYDAQYHVNHREKRSVYDAQHYAEHRDKIVIRQARYRTEHKREKSIYSAQYIQTPNGKASRRAARQRRRARKLFATGTHTAADIKRQIAAQKGKCWWCSKICADEYHIDHIIPLAKGGHNNPSNLVISCPECNLKKYTKFPSEFIGRLL